MQKIINNICLELQRGQEGLIKKKYKNYECKGEGRWYKNNQDRPMAYKDCNNLIKIIRTHQEIKKRELSLIYMQVVCKDFQEIISYYQKVVRKWL